MKYLIQANSTDSYFLDGHDGTNWEWTKIRSQAWKMDLACANRRLAIIRQSMPYARVVAVKQPRKKKEKCAIFSPSRLQQIIRAMKPTD